eukprot:6104022-Prymnesium_polylepis.1
MIVHSRQAARDEAPGGRRQVERGQVDHLARPAQRAAGSRLLAERHRVHQAGDAVRLIDAHRALLRGQGHRV